MPEYTPRGIRYPLPGDHMRGTSASRSVIDDLRDLATTADHADNQVLNEAKSHTNATVTPVRNDLNLLDQYSMRIQHVYELPNDVDGWIGHDKRGIYQAPIQSVVDELVGAPEGSGPAIISVIPISTSGGVLIVWNEYSGQQRVWHRTLSSTPANSRPWQLVGGGATGHAGVSGSGTKTIPLSLTVGNSGGQTSPTSGDVVIPTNWNAPILRWRVAVRDGNARFGTAQSNPTVFTDITANGQVVIEETSMPAGTEIHYFPWVQGNPNQTIGYTYSAQLAPGARTGGGTLNGQNVTSLPFEMWVEAEVPAWVPVVAVVGDSNSVGVGTDTPIHDSWLSQYVRGVGALPVHYGHSGDYYGASTNSGHYKWTRWQHLDRPDVAIVALGSNDAGIGTPLAELQGQARTVWEIVSDLVTPNLHAVTIKPRNSGDETYNSIRRGYNDWITTFPEPLRVWHDMVTPVSSDDVTMDPGMYAPDGTHMSTVGHKALADSITVPVAVSGRTQVAEVSPGIYEIGA